MSPPSVFLSHTSVDKKFVERLALDLAAQGIKVWFDKWEIKVGDSIVQKVSSGIADNQYVAVVFSSAANESEWVQREFGSALTREIDTRNIVVLPILLDNCQLPALIRDKRYADFRGSYEAGIEQLIHAVLPSGTSQYPSPKAIRDARALVASVVATNTQAENLFSNKQFESLYAVRNALHPYLGKPERQAIVLSGLNARNSDYANHSDLITPSPFWGLVDGISENDITELIVDGIQGGAFDLLAPHFEWATTVDPTISPDILLKALREQKALNKPIDTVGTQTREAMRAALLFLATERSELFEAELKASVQQGREPLPMILASAARWRHPPNLEQLSEVKASNDWTFFEKLRVFCELGFAEAVPLLRDRLKGKGIKTPFVVDKMFELLARSPFSAELRRWATSENDSSIKAKVLSSLAFSGDTSIAETIGHEIKSRRSGGSNRVENPTLLRAWAFTGRADTADLERIAIEGHQFERESAIFALASSSSSSLADVLEIAAQDESAGVVNAAVLSSLSVEGAVVLPEERLLDHKSKQVRASLWFVLAMNGRWDKYLETSRETDPIVLRARGRAIASVADRAVLDSLLCRADTDEQLLVCCDEALYAPNPFRSVWLQGLRAPIIPTDSRYGRIYPRAANGQLDVITTEEDTVRWGLEVLAKED